MDVHLRGGRSIHFRPAGCYLLNYGKKYYTKSFTEILTYAIKTTLHEPNHAFVETKYPKILECITMPHFEVGTTKGMQRAMQDAIIFRK
jgi:hypothetical protein